MKKMIYSIAAVSLMITAQSCRSGEDAAPEYYFRAKINGQQKDFLKDAKFQADVATWQHIVLGGDQIDGDASVPAFAIELWNEGGTITTGTYNYQTNGDSPDPNDYSLDGMYYYQTSTGTVIYDNYETENFTFNITELSKEKGIRGTFSGTVSSDDFPGQVWTVENGEVFLPYNVTVN